MCQTSKTPPPWGWQFTFRTIEWSHLIDRKISLNVSVDCSETEKSKADPEDKEADKGWDWLTIKF